MDITKRVASCCSRRLEDCGQSLSENSKENLKEIKEARNRCQEAGKGFFSKTDPASSRPVRSNTSSPSKVRGQSSNTSYPGKVRGPSGNTFSLGKVRGQSDNRSSKQSNLHYPSSSTSDCQILKSSIMGSPIKAPGSLQRQSKNKIVSFNKEDASKTSTEQISLEKRGIHGEDIGLGASKSDCVAFSSLESVSVNKLYDRNALGRKVLAGNSKNRQDGVHFVEPLSIQKKKSKIFSLDHMQHSLDILDAGTSILPKTAQLPSQPHSRPCDTRTTCHIEKQEKVCGDLKAVKPDTEKTTDTTNASSTVNTSGLQMAAENYEISQPAIELFVPVVKFSEFFNVEQKICTHASDQSWLLSPVGDSSTILEIKNISSTPQTDARRKEKKDVSNVQSDEQFSHKSECKLSDTENKSDLVDKSQLDIDIDCIRSLQSMFLKSKIKKACPPMESEAIAQDLWHLLGSKKEECDQRKSEMAVSERLNSLDIILDKATMNLECLSLLNAQIDEDVTEISPVMDITQHLPTRGFLVTDKQENETDLYSEKLDRALRESEHLLAELGLFTGDRVHSSSSQCQDSAQQLARNVSAGHRDLRECHKDVNLFMA